MSNLRDKTCILLSTLFGIGYIPIGGGSVAALLGVLIYLLINRSIYFLIFTIIVLIISSITTYAEKIFGEKDSRYIVIDDFLGMLISLLFIPHEPRFLFLAFFLFRALDMIKIPPADKIEKYKGAIGIVGDDVIAGIFANLILHLAIFLVE